MDSREAEEQLAELESRLERLRALYEQYFMGVERMEPQIPRKEVERRIWLLRREQIRNTGLRFKFQMLVQRFNTFQQYWGRVAREIENGTYRRDVLRAAARFGEKEALTIVGRRRRDKYLRLAEAQKREQDSRGSRPPQANGQDEVEELEADVLESVPPTPVPLAEPPRPSFGRAPPPVADPEAARRRVAALAAQMKSPAERAAAPVTSGPLDLDLDLDTRRPAARKTSSGRMRAVTIPQAPAVPTDLALSAQGASRRPGAPEPAAPTVARGTRPPPRRRSSSMKAVRPVPQPVEPPAPIPASAPRAPEPPPRAPAPAPARADELQEQRLRQIYASYLESKRRANESTAGLTYEKLAESLRNQAAKLREAHPTRRVDYEVIVKNGKTVLKPILR